MCICFCISFLYKEVHVACSTKTGVPVDILGNGPEDQEQWTLVFLVVASLKILHLLNGMAPESLHCKIVF